jgi:signal transduction histidine kinase
VTFENDFLKLTIFDNGIGFKRENKLAGNGLLNMEQRASIMKADLSILSLEGTGTTIILNTKIK